MRQAINRYKADLRDFQFLLFEQFRVQELLRQQGNDDWDEQQIRVVLDEAYRFVTEVLGPLDAAGDREGCIIDAEGRVRTPTGFKDAWKRLYEAGWKGMSAAPEHGGQGAPRTLEACVDEMIMGANSSFAMYPGVTQGAADVIARCGTERQQQLFGQRMFRGVWGGTMCLTEPQAGSDVGAVASRATKNPDGTYRIRGTKVFISCGDNDAVENIVHLVLARIEGARPGTKGLSLFIVPRMRVNDDGSLARHNDVRIASLEHKMGLHGSATCVINFGDDDDCIGETVGNVEHQGMAQMFLLMNTARIGVGVQGLALGAASYLAAADYAKQRTQGTSANDKSADAAKVHIIEHADVRRMLLEMKSRVEGTRALAHKLSNHQQWAKILVDEGRDEAAYHQGQVELLTPLLKSYGSDMAFEVSALAVQAMGGSGFLADYPVEQHCRDARVFAIYEGTNHIQALDLVGRKLAQNGGRNIRAFLSDVQRFAIEHEDHPVLATAIGQLRQAHEAVAGTVLTLSTWTWRGRVDLVPLVANRFLTMMSELTLGFLLLDQAVIAIDKLAGATDADRAFYEGKKFTAMFFAHNTLPHVLELARVVSAGDRSALEMPEDAFGA